MNRNRQLRLLSVRFSAALGGAILALLAQATSAQDLKPFTARYQARFHGVSGGILELKLSKGAQPDQYIYESRAKPSFLGSFMISESALETSTIVVDANGVRPIKFFSDDGKKGDAKDSALQFDWQQKRLSGRAETVDMDRELPDRLQDHLSIQVAIIWALQHGVDVGELPLVDGGEIKRYRYINEGPATLKHKGRQLATTLLRSERTDSTGGRTNRYWHAAELGNIPVKAERSRNGKIDLTMELIDVKFTD